jgi:hypothetical protein
VPLPPLNILARVDTDVDDDDDDDDDDDNNKCRRPRGFLRLFVIYFLFIDLE